MDRRTLNQYLAVVLTTVAECGEAPEGVLYAGLMAHGCTMQDWAIIVAALTKGELVRVEWNVMRLTDKGRDVAAKCEAFARKAGAA